MQKHGPLGYTRGATGVLQYSNIGCLGVGLLKRGFRSLGHCGIEAHRCRQVERRHHFLTHHVVDQGALEQPELVTHGTQDHMLYRRCVNALFQRGGKIFDDDNCLRTGILELVLQFARGVERVHIDHNKTGTQYACHGYRVLRHIGHHDGNTISFD